MPSGTPDRSAASRRAPPALARRQHQEPASVDAPRPCAPRSCRRRSGTSRRVRRRTPRRSGRSRAGCSRQVGAEERRADHRDLDAVGRELVQHRLRERHDACLDRVVRRHARRVHQPGHRGDVHDRGRDPCSLNSGVNVRQPRTTPSRLISTIHRQSSIGTTSMRPPAPTPALLMRMSRPPQCSTTQDSAFSQASSSRTSSAGRQPRRRRVRRGSAPGVDTRRPGRSTSTWSPRAA